MVHPGLLSISGHFLGILLDAYGVFWGGNGIGLLPGSKEVLKELVSSGKIVGILSNSTQLSIRERDKIKKAGLIQGEHYHFFITSGDVTRDFFQQYSSPFPVSQNKFFLFGGAHPTFKSHEAIFQDSPFTETQDLKEADFIYISVPHRGGEDQTDPHLFKFQVDQVLSSGLPMVCANPDRFAHEGNPPRAVVRQGSIAALYEQAGGSVVYFGKPSPLAFAAAMEQFRLHGLENPATILMVGDTPETDIRGAKLAGMASALITQTGIMADRIDQQGEDVAIQALPQTDIPDFFIERL
jgi:HAD superfamily hydrolase (TIGR01459 family)